MKSVCPRLWWTLSLCLVWVVVAVATPAKATGVDWKQALGERVQRGSEVALFGISGSNTLGARLAPALVQAFFAAEGLQDVHITALRENEQRIEGVWMGGARPIRVTVAVKAHGTRTGFEALQRGEADLAAASRPLTETEAQGLASLGNLRSPGQEHVVAIDGLAIIVHPDNPLRQLDIAQITALFNGSVNNWRALGGPERQVRIYARDDKSGTYDTFERLVLRGASLDKRALRFESNDLLAQSVMADPGGVGFVPLANAAQAHALAVADSQVAALPPTVLTVASEDYLLSRRLYLYSLPEQRRSAGVSAFLAFVQSDAGQRIVEGSGFVAQALHPVAVNPADARLLGWQRLNLNLRFADGASDLDTKAQVDVERLASYINRQGAGDVQLTLVGFSNPLSSHGQSALSRLRAQNVRWALRQQGVRSPIETLAGDAVLVADPRSPQADRNRRVEVWIRQ